MTFIALLLLLLVLSRNAFVVDRLKIENLLAIVKPLVVSNFKSNRLCFHKRLQ